MHLLEARHYWTRTDLTPNKQLQVEHLTMRYDEKICQRHKCRCRWVATTFIPDWNFSDSTFSRSKPYQLRLLDLGQSTWVFCPMVCRMSVEVWNFVALSYRILEILRPSLGFKSNGSHVSAKVWTSAISEVEKNLVNLPNLSLISFLVEAPHPRFVKPGKMADWLRKWHSESSCLEKENGAIIAAAVVSAFVECKECKQVDEKKLMNQETNHFRQLQVSSCRELKYRNYFWLFGNWSTVTIFDFSGTEYVTKSEKSRDR